MIGIDMNRDICYSHASLRFFDEHEHHVERFCEDDVLLLVYEGVLRFTEDGIAYEVHPGEYHIQKQNTFQSGNLPSDSPKYLYVHFQGEWTQDSLLPKRGTFEYSLLKDDIQKMNDLFHNNAPYILQTETFYRILSKLCSPAPSDTIAHQIARYIQNHFHRRIALENLCQTFSYSKNHIINIFKKEFGQTPFEYLNRVRIEKAKQLLIMTSKSIEEIALECGYVHYSHFYRQFVHQNHLSPETFRRHKRLGNR